MRENDKCESVRATCFASRDDAGEVGATATLQRLGAFFLQPSRVMLLLLPLDSDKGLVCLFIIFFMETPFLEFLWAPKAQTDGFLWFDKTSIFCFMADTILSSS